MIRNEDITNTREWSTDFKYTDSLKKLIPAKKLKAKNRNSPNRNVLLLFMLCIL